MSGLKNFWLAVLLSLAVAASIFFRFTNTFFGSGGYPSMRGRGI